MTSPIIWIHEAGKCRQRRTIPVGICLRVYTTRYRCVGERTVTVVQIEGVVVARHPAFEEYHVADKEVDATVPVVVERIVDGRAIQKVVRVVAGATNILCVHLSIIDGVAGVSDGTSEVENVVRDEAGGFIGQDGRL